MDEVVGRKYRNEQQFKDEVWLRSIKVLLILISYKQHNLKIRLTNSITLTINNRLQHFSSFNKTPQSSQH